MMKTDFTASTREIQDVLNTVHKINLMNMDFEVDMVWMYPQKQNGHYR